MRPSPWPVLLPPFCPCCLPGRPLPPAAAGLRLLSPSSSLFALTGEAPFCAPAFSYVVRTKKGPLLCHTCTWFVTRKAPCYLAVTWERRRTKILKGLCGVIGWFQVAADIGLPLK